MTPVSGPLQRDPAVTELTRLRLRTSARGRWLVLPVPASDTHIRRALARFLRGRKPGHREVVGSTHA